MKNFEPKIESKAKIELLYLEKSCLSENANFSERWPIQRLLSDPRGSNPSYDVRNSNNVCLTSRTSWGELRKIPSKETFASIPFGRVHVDGVVDREFTVFFT